MSGIAELKRAHDAALAKVAAADAHLAACEEAAYASRRALAEAILETPGTTLDGLIAGADGHSFDGDADSAESLALRAFLGKAGLVLVRFHPLTLFAKTPRTGHEKTGLLQMLRVIEACPQARTDSGRIGLCLMDVDGRSFTLWRRDPGYETTGADAFRHPDLEGLLDLCLEGRGGA